LLAQNPFWPKIILDYVVQPGGELRNYKDIPTGPIPDDLARQLKRSYYTAISYTDAQPSKAPD